MTPTPVGHAVDERKCEHASAGQLPDLTVATKSPARRPIRSTGTPPPFRELTSSQVLALNSGIASRFRLRSTQDRVSDREADRLQGL